MTVMGAGAWITTVAAVGKMAYDVKTGMDQKKQMKSDQKDVKKQAGLAEEQAKKIQRDRMTALASGGRQSTAGGPAATLG